MSAHQLERLIGWWMLASVGVCVLWCALVLAIGEVSERRARRTRRREHRCCPFCSADAAAEPTREVSRPAGRRIGSYR